MLARGLQLLHLKSSSHFSVTHSPLKREREIKKLKEENPDITFFNI